MARRISREEYDQLLSAARSVYSRNIEAAGGDSGKVDLAAKNLAWAEEAAREALTQRSGLYKFFDSVPLIGKPVAIVLDSVEEGIRRHGLVLGLTRGLLVGLIIAAALLVVSEGAALAFELGRSWIALNWGNGIKAQQRDAASNRAYQEVLDTVMHLGAEVNAKSIRYYVVEHVYASIYNGAVVYFENLTMSDPDVVRRGPRDSGSEGISIKPFYMPSGKVAVLEDPETKVDYVFAATAGDLSILIPKKDYNAAHLPSSDGSHKNANKK
jgi:hypothetical protein